MKGTIKRFGEEDEHFKQRIAYVYEEVWQTYQLVKSECNTSCECPPNNVSSVERTSGDGRPSGQEKHISIIIRKKQKLRTCVSSAFKERSAFLIDDMPCRAGDWIIV